ncbi:RpiB/LacA/LacB family sugar-phosphate isomerase [Microbacterium album]|uniref:Ribose-5-phosphate isomerase n=1 Tax=Microbacterium album TaxID=2053191 RepID=A0A917MK75_9MICO|nr:RpiB/LacA/LacB family sugar-phosphate isomerase [Microbacterium album]GGH33560.1 ribose-5-phosphate isomerase [Microbacterium album]
MTRIHIAADHGGYEIGRALQARALAAGHDVIWHGPDALDPGDDYPAFAVRVGKAVVDDQDAALDAFGVLVVEDPAFAVVAANKVTGARALPAVSPNVAIAGRKGVDANVLVLGGDALEQIAWQTLIAFVTTKLDHAVDPARRVLQIQEYESAGTIEGWAVQLEPEQVAVQHD